jgi:hypothetical protein
MFQWAQIALDYMHSSKDSRMMAKRLESLWSPKGTSRLKGLFKLYDAIYDKMMAEVDADTIPAIITAFVFLLHGTNKNSGDITEACTFAETGDMKDPYHHRQISGLCPSFLLCDEDSTDDEDSAKDLRFAHFSVREYLLERHPSVYFERTDHAQLASLCMQVFLVVGISEGISTIMPETAGLIIYAAKGQLANSCPKICDRSRLV